MKRNAPQTTYLFVTDGDQYDAAGVDAHGVWVWSCSKTASAGDKALIYVKGVGVAYEWEITSKARPDDEWRYACDVAHLRDFRPPIPIREIRSAFPSTEWPAPYTNFRGFRSIRLTPKVAEKLRGLRPATKR